MFEAIDYISELLIIKNDNSFRINRHNYTIQKNIKLEENMTNLYYEFFNCRFQV